MRDERPSVRCPACHVSPLVGQMWVCGPDGCGAFFDTFETRARCPECGAVFSWTDCPSCGRRTAHAAWYGAAG